jgi:hypothetical protein
MSIVVNLPPGSRWTDVTADLSVGTPQTIALPDGVGALQISGAVYQSGARPDATSVQLAAMLKELAEKNHLGPPFDTKSVTEPLLIEAASYQTADFVRIWYLSNGESFALATYTSDIDADYRNELLECEGIVRAIGFSANAS